MKLTPKQKEALQAVCSGEVETKNYGYGALRVTGGNPTVVGRLAGMGLVNRPVTSGPWTLADKGRVALEQS